MHRGNLVLVYRHHVLLGLLVVVVWGCGSAVGVQVGVTVMYPETNLQGQQLFLRGDGLGLNWNAGRPVPRVGTDRFALTLDFNAADVGQLVQMKALIGDRYWQMGANEMIELRGFGFNITLYPWFQSSTGRYFVINSIPSPQLGNTRDMVMYIPPSYGENPYKSYELLVMHDGQNLFNDSTAFLGRFFLHPS